MSLAKHLTDIAVRVTELEGEILHARVRIAQQDDREADLARRMYRRGYNAGYWAGKNGRVQSLAPERLARGDLKEMLS
jgi:hypothetical protein